MSGTYLVCDRCGNHGPPAGFFFREGVRLCYACYYGEADQAPVPAAPDESRDEAERGPAPPDVSSPT